MKKYTILDSDGQKKIIYAPNMKKALRYVGDGEKTTVKDSKFYVILSNYDYTKAQAEKDARKYGLKLQILGPANGSKQETEAYLVGPRANIVRMLKETDMDEFEGDIEDSVKDSRIKDIDALEGEYHTKYGDKIIVSKVNASTYSYFDADTKHVIRVSINALKEDIKAKRLIKDSKVKDEDDYFYFDADEDDRSLDDYKRIMRQCGLTITKVEGNNREAFIYYRGSSSAEQKAAKMLGISLEDSVKDSKVKDDTNRSKTFKFFINNRAVSENEYIKYFIEEAANEHQSSTTAKRVINENKEDAKDSGKNTFMFESGRKFSIVYDSVKDADTNIVDKLISEEEKAVMDYKEALMADSDSSANAVYAHILAEELEHLRELRSLREQPSLGDSIKDAKWNTYNAVNYKFERNYWHIFSIFNRNEMLDNDVRALARKLNLIVEPYDKYNFKRHNKNDKDVYYDDYRVKGKDKDNVIKFCETLNPLVKPLKFDLKDSLREQPSLGDSIKDEVQTAETYANTGWIEKLASDLLNEGQKNGYDFDAVLKKFDSLSKQILVIVKNALDKAKKEVVDYKSRY